ncbi:hypothetical protein ABIB28_002824 [Sphingomonas sp. UYEF23]
MAAAYPSDAPPGPAGRWLINHLKQAAMSRQPRPKPDIHNGKSGSH